MARQMTVGYSHFKTKNDATYQPAFGKHTRGQRDVKEEMHRIYNETGRKIEEVGDGEPTATTKDDSLDMQDVAECYRSIKKNHARQGLV